jgi:DNA-binding GntR family transcriptional regulator
VHLPNNSAGKVEAAYEKLKLLVVTNQFLPNEHLQINNLTERLAVGITPLREALIRLAVEDLITQHPKRGFFAKVLTVSELSELYQLAYSVLKSSLQCDMGRLDVACMTSEIARILTSTPNDQPSIACALAIERLYEQLTMMSENVQMLKVIRNYNERTHAVRLIHVEQIETVESITGYIFKLLKLLKTNDREAVATKLQQRFDAKVTRLPQLIKEASSRAFSSQWSDYAVGSFHFAPEGSEGAGPSNTGLALAAKRHAYIWKDCPRVSGGDCQHDT